MKTFKAIIQDLEQFSTDHHQLNSFGWGNISNIVTKDFTYPMLWVQPIQSGINGSQFTLSLEIYIMDLQEQDSSNLLDLMNETLLIGRDIIAEYFEDNDGIEFELNENNVRIAPFDGKFDDLLSGWIFTVELTVRLNKNKCITPTV
jgi:hypothetical protein